MAFPGLVVVLIGLSCVLGCVLLVRMAGLGAAAWVVGAMGLCVCACALGGARRIAPIGAQDAYKLYALSPAEFERHVAELFAAAGYVAHVVGGSGDGGVDVRVWRDGWCGVVQCKRYRPDRVLGPAVVREIVGTRAHERARYAWLATTAPLSSAARQLAREEGVGVLDVPLLVMYCRRRVPLVRLARACLRV
jgi:HJR/Mrr/RecB family endonuclease